MKKVLLSILLFVSFLPQAQEKQEKKSELESVLKFKLGFSQLHLGNRDVINGNVTQFDFLVSNKISNKFRLECGFGFSAFNGNDVYNSELVSVKNEYLKIPLNITYSKDFSNEISLLYSLGIYGNYLYKSDIPSYFQGNNVGWNIGGSFQIGPRFKLKENIDIRIMFESQSDFSKIVKQRTIKQQEKNSSLLSMSLVYKL